MILPDKIAKWRGLVPDDELAAYAKGKFGNRIGFGAKAALLNIDTTYMFVDPAYAMTAAERPGAEDGAGRDHGRCSARCSCRSTTRAATTARTRPIAASGT